MRAGTFREDLFHRLNVIRVHSPALRERREDSHLRLAHYLERAASEIGGGPKALKPEVVRYLKTLDWPGNVRQLENACRWLTVMASGNEIHLDDAMPKFETVLIKCALGRTGGRRLKAARLLGWGARNTLTRKIKVLTLDV